jgi:hypothetical protein
MIHNINFNKIIFIDWSETFIMPKHVFFDLFDANTMSNILQMIKNQYFENVFIKRHYIIMLENCEKYVI